ncbi:hypothetical protein F2Q68_00010019 [Brassica cretica]|uniref:Uncharacterized protein n=1 Tax=Brassica cretica TaxID=69181 RepID=A0A8S9KT85_BRACR|nr:hypothetical protein F2Q68_00010019 [Brassica cretica]
MAASMQQMQQQMQLMQDLQQTIAAQQLAAQREPPVPIGEMNLPRNIPATRSAIAPPPCQREDFKIKPGMINLVQRKMFHGDTPKTGSLFRYYQTSIVAGCDAPVQQKKDRNLEITSPRN